MSLLKNSVFKNMSWLVAGKIFQSLIGLVISILSARFLGPSNFGIISYAAAIVAFVLPLMQLGISNVLVYEITNNPEEEGTLLGTSFVMCGGSAIACVIGCTTFAIAANFGETETIVVCFLYSISLLFQVFELFQYWFQAKLLSKFYSIATLIAYTAVSGLKLVLLMTNQSIYWFAVTNSFDFIIVGALLLLFFKKRCKSPLRFSHQVAKRLIHKSKHYLLPGMMAAIYAQTDKIMLKLMIDSSATGHYAIAVSCAGMSGFVFLAIIDSFRPLIFRLKKEGNEEQYEDTISLLYHVTFYLSLLQSIVMTLLAEWLIQTLYGPEYSPSALPLKIVCWYVAFSYAGTIKAIWMLGENKQKYLWIMSAAGALINVIGNALLIPLIGIAGAAASSLVTQIACNFLVVFFIRPIRRNNRLLLAGLNPLFIRSYMRKYRNKS